VKRSLPAAQREGRQAARAVDEFLMGASDLPR
jgi:NADPH-dependent glutamate synthase beta subunit-like oxidoreductase